MAATSTHWPTGRVGRLGDTSGASHRQKSRPQSVEPVAGGPSVISNNIKNTGQQSSNWAGAVLISDSAVNTRLAHVPHAF